MRKFKQHKSDIEEELFFATILFVIVAYGVMFCTLSDLANNKQYEIGCSADCRMLSTKEVR